VSNIFKIGEFSKLVRVSPRMLRHYEKHGLLRPAEVDRFTGYRLYSAEQIHLLLHITELRDMGFGVEEIEKALPHYDDADFMQKTLERKATAIQNIIAAENAKLQKIQSKKENLMIYEAELKDIPAMKVISLRETVPPEAEDTLWEKMWTFLGTNKATGYSIYHDDEYKDDEADIEIAVPTDTMGENKDGFAYKILPAIEKAATIRFSGSYENYNAAMEKLALWIEKSGYEFNGQIRGFGVEIPGLTELQVPVK